VTEQLDRRNFLGRGLKGAAGLAAVGFAGPGLLAACSSSDTATGTTGGTTASGGADLGVLDYQFSWIKNTEFAGQYIADKKGYYKEVGFSGVNFLAGGPTVQQDSIVASGKAFVGCSAPDIAAPAIIGGAPIIAVGALFQKNPFCVMSLATNPLPDPQSMIGKKVGVQAVNEPVWSAFLTANDIDPASIEKVPVQFDPTPLTQGEVDGWFSFVTNEPNLLEHEGIKTVNFLLNDFNYPLVSQIMIVQTKSLQADRAKIKAVMKADVMGWRESVKDPTLGPKYTVEDYGKDLGLNEEEQVLESKAQNALIMSPDVEKNGILTMTDELVASTMATLDLAGVDIEQDKLFDLSILKEFYEENPELKTPL
jgi:ABC-type nitrate/sulfonate/bicarbonate transport system substrate-binding protein